MPFKANDTNINTKGRAKGVKNKLTCNTRSLLEGLFNENLSVIIANADTFTMKERMQLNKDILPFILPRYTTVNQIEFDIESALNNHILERSIKLLSTAELNELLKGGE
jgi:septum formation topological specificity factor MinE